MSDRSGPVGNLFNHQLTEAVVVSLGGFVFGYDLGGISSATQSLQDHFHLSAAVFGLTISFSLWGTVCGSLLAGRWADRIGRRSLVAGCAILYALAASATTFKVPSEWVLLLAIRFFCGLAIGGFTVGCPLYLAELAPTRLRGRFVSLFQVQVGAGVVLAFAAGSLFARLAPPDAVWRWCLGLGAVPATLLVILLWTRSAKGLLAAAMRKNERRENAVATDAQNRLGAHRLFVRRNLRPLLLATSIAVFNQLSGVNIVLLYMLQILSSAGISLNTGHSYTVVISCLSLATTVLGLAFVDRAGRKPLLLIGSAGMAACLLCLAVMIPYRAGPLVYLTILVAYNAFFAFSQGTVVWVYLSELFPLGIRGAGQGYGTCVHWIVNASLVLAFPIIQHASSVSIFYWFAGMMVLQIGVVKVWYPETRGVALGSLAPDKSRM